MTNHCIASTMMILCFALVAAVMVEARPEVEKTTESEPGCISNFQSCLDSIQPCCQPENPTAVPFGHEEYICDRSLAGICAPVIVVTNLTLYLELSRGIDETKSSHLSNLHITGAPILIPEFKPESKIEDERKSLEAPQLESQCIPNYELCVNLEAPCCWENKLFAGSSKPRNFVCGLHGRSYCSPFDG